MNAWLHRGRLLGTSPPVRERDAHLSTYAPKSVVYICPNCSESWGRILVGGSPESWRITPRRCEKHGGGFLLPYQYDNLADSAPLEVLTRELMLITGMSDPARYQQQLWITGI